MKLLSLILLFIHAGLFSQQDSVALRFSTKINRDSLKSYLSVLASDEYEGRETGQKGQKMAAEFIMNKFKKFEIPSQSHLTNGYHQSFLLNVYQPPQIRLIAGKDNDQLNADFFTFSSGLFDSLYTTEEITFAGYGINTVNYNDYHNVNVKDKVVLILNGEPVDKNGNSFVSSKTTSIESTMGIRKKIIEAEKQGASVLLIVDPKLKETYKKFEHRINSSRMLLSEDQKIKDKKSILVLFVSEQMANQLMKRSIIKKAIKSISKTKKPNSFNIQAKIQIDLKQKVSFLNSENVLGYVEGTELKNELLVITAHYDHLGKHNGVVYNGADDDGSGTAAVIELARVFAQAKKEGKGPKRSILFMTVSGEEKGLLGSDYYTKHPVYPLVSTVCNLNIDMIGRIDDSHEGNPNYVYLIGSDKLSKDLHNISEQANATYSKLKLDYTFNDENDPNRYYYRSDHYNFAKNNIPVIFYFNGVHEDYHKETDEVQKINFQKMENISKLIFFTAWEIANRNERINLNEK